MIRPTIMSHVHVAADIWLYTTLPEGECTETAAMQIASKFVGVVKILAAAFMVEKLVLGADW